ncbi:MAG: phage major capsid protein [Oscillospiraceae bacterium]|jgi:hypothetical protein|nr:phage major capsid protein [Oscillospiraceae bacterium]
MNYKNINLEKSMYKTGNKDFTAVLESLDPSENYKGTELESLDAYQRQLKRFDIKVSGPESDIVEKFFINAESAILFPEYISRAITQGINWANILPEIIATRIKIHGIDYRPIQSVTSDLPSGITTNAVAEGASLREVNITTDPNLVKLIKHGRTLSCSYEALRHQNLETLTVILRKIGSDIADEQFEDVLEVLEKNAFKIDVSGLSDGNLSYENLLKIWEALSPYQLNIMLASTSSVRSILALPEIKDTVSGMNFKSTGRLITPLGAQLIRVNLISGNVVYGLDKNFALQMIQSGGILIDYDKVIDRQLEKSAITITTGFAKFFGNTIVKLIY